MLSPLFLHGDSTVEVCARTAIIQAISVNSTASQTHILATRANHNIVRAYGSLPLVLSCSSQLGARSLRGSALGDDASSYASIIQCIIQHTAVSQFHLIDDKIHYTEHQYIDESRRSYQPTSAYRLPTVIRRGRAQSVAIRGAQPGARREGQRIIGHRPSESVLPCFWWSAGRGLCR